MKFSFAPRTFKRVLATVLGIGVLTTGLAACGHRPWHDGPMSAEAMTEMRAKMIARVSDKLDLNADQQKRLNTLADKLQEQRAALRGNATTDPRTQVQALIAGDKFDKARAQALVNEKTAAIQGKSPEVLAALADFYDSLNPAQQQKVRDFLNRRGHHGWQQG